MKKYLCMLLALLLAAALPLGAMAEVAEPTAQAVEQAVPETEVALEGEDAPAGYADFVGEASVSAAGDEDIPLDKAHFPDVVFRKYLKKNYDENSNDLLEHDEVRFGISLNLSDLDVASLDGLEYLPDVSHISVSGTKITELDISSCADTLCTLYCSETKLTTLNVSNCPKLYWLECENSKLKSLNASGCTNLDAIYCSNNPLSKLNIKGCTGLDYLFCSNTDLTSLDLRGLTSLQNLTCDGCKLTRINATGCAALAKIYCPSNSALARIDLAGCTALEEFVCSESPVSTISFKDCVALKDVSLSDSQVTKLDLSNNKKLEQVFITFNPALTSLKLGKLSKLDGITCFDNALTKLDVSGCPALDTLDCRENAIKSLNLSGCKKLTWLLCQDNQLEKLDLSACTKLEHLKAGNNKLTALDVTMCPNLDHLEAGNNAIPVIDLRNCSKLIKYANMKPDTLDGVAYRGTDEYGWSIIISNEETRLITKTESLAKAKVTVKAQTYTGKALKPAVTVKLNGQKLTKGTDYTVKYSNNKNIGTATVTVTGKGFYKGTAKQTFKIALGKVSGLALKAGTKKLTASWKKGKAVSGYEIQYGLKKSFSDAKGATVEDAATLSTTLSGLTAGKTYYVRIRAYKTIGSKTYYSAWSDAVSAKTK